MEQGEIIESGTHEELLEKQGQYYRLWEMQQGNFKVKKEDKEATDADLESEYSFDENEMSYT